MSQTDEYFQEARRRILEAKETGADALNFIGFGLTSLPAKIGQLTNLTTLDLSSNSLTGLPAGHSQYLRP